jgi:uncharacterized protein YkwD
MSRKTNAAAGVHLWVALAVATLAGCAFAPAPSSDEPSTAVLSGPADVPAIGCNAAALRQSVLQRVNQARTSGQLCGDSKQSAVKPLVWQPALAAAATRRANEMAQRGTFGTPDRAMEQRLRQEGYRATAAQENAAAGDFSPDMVAQAWLSQQPQCTALMNPAYTDVGAGCASAPGTEWGHYFTVVVAKPGEGGMAKPPAKAKGNAKSKAKPKDKSTKPVAKPKAKAAATATAPRAKAAGTGSRPAAAPRAIAANAPCTKADCKATPTVR